MRRMAYGEPRVFYIDPPTAQLHSLPLAWTDLAPPDPYRLVAAEHALLRLADLRALAALVRALHAAHDGRTP